MSSKYTGTAIVIPTRNRCQLAINAINSALRFGSENVKIIVSDNSTDKQEIENLKTFCAQNKFENLFYIHPPEPLAMSAHWEWFRQEISAMFGLSHLLILSDRMVFIGHELEKVLKCAKLFPEKVISYGMDEIDDQKYPFVFKQAPRTYKFFNIKSDFFLKFSSRSRWNASIPRMMNCIVPVSVFDKVVASFGNVFESVAPDFCFAYKCLDVIEEFLYYNSSVVLSYNLNRSNGGGVASGNFGSDTKDFFSQLKKDGILFNGATPVPEFSVLINAIVQEYCFVKNHSQSNKFPELNISDYFQAIKEDIETLIDNKQVKAQMMSLYAQKYEEFKESINENNERESEIPFFDKALTKLIRNTLSVLPNFKEEFYGKLTTWKNIEEALTYAETMPVKKQRIGLSSIEYDLGVKLQSVKVS